MKYLSVIFFVILFSTAGYAQDPVISGNDYIQSPPQCPPGKKFDPNASKDMNNTMDMNNPLYMENNGTLGDQYRNSDFVSNPTNFYFRNMDINPSPDSALCRNDFGGTFNNNGGQKSKKETVKGWNKIKHNKLTKHLFNQTLNS
jgi:hypothetical protein